MEYLYFAEYRSKLDDENVLVIHVASNPNYMKSVKYKALMDGKETDVTMVVRDTIRARYWYTKKSIFFTCEYQFVIPVTPDFKSVKLTIVSKELEEDTPHSIVVKGSRYRKMLNVIPGNVDCVVKEENKARVMGWASDNEKVDIYAMANGQKIDAELVRPFRKDIVDYYLEDECNFSAGFELVVDDKYDRIDVVCEVNGKKTVHPVSLNKTNGKTNSIAEAFKKASNYRKRYGVGVMISKVFQKVFGMNVYDYNSYIRTLQPDANEIKKQREEKFEKTPLFSIVVPVYRPKKQFFEEMINSVKAQSYENWELCLADGSGKGFEMDLQCEKIINSDKRIKYKKLQDNLGISGNTNAALELATGDYIVLGDHDDLIAADALYECVKLINQNDDVEVIYTDEDKYDYVKKKRIEPNFKPDFNLFMLRNVNYICHLFVFSREIYKKVGEFRSEFDGAQDYDFILRCAETAKEVHHIPRILYSWRGHENSTASNPESKRYAFEAGTAAIKAHLERMNVKAEVSMNQEFPGLYRVKYIMDEKPMVSVIIPSMNHTDDLDVCIRSLEKQNYKNFEIIIVENNSNEETFEYYDKITKEFDNVVIVKWEGKGFNFSKINNFGIESAKGEYLLLLNNDTEMIGEDCLEEIMNHAVQPGVGMVGTKLLYSDNTVQHCGVIVGLGGVAGHVHVGVPADQGGYQNYIYITREFSAVTAACAMIKKSVFDEVGGFEEDLAVAFNDIDLCLKVRKKGYKILYNPSAVLYHYESKSRGYEDTPEKIIRFQKECKYFATRWDDIVTNGDPYYNPNLSLTKTDFSLREI